MTAIETFMKQKLDRFDCKNVYCRINKNPSVPYPTGHKSRQVIKPTLLQVTRLDKHSLLNCKSVGLIYLVKCHICHLQYLGKSETAFNLQLKGNRKYSTAKKPLLLCKHFKASNQTKKLNLYKKNNETS